MIGYQIIFFDWSDDNTYFSNIFINKEDAEKIVSFYTKDEAYFDIMSIIFGKYWYDKSWNIEFYNMETTQEKLDAFKKRYKEVHGVDTDYSDGVILGALWISKKLNYLKGSYLDIEIETIDIY